MHLNCHVTSHDHLIERTCEWELLVLCHYADNSCDYKHCYGDGESPSCQVWLPLVQRKWRYKVFNMKRGLQKATWLWDQVTL